MEQGHEVHIVYQTSGKVAVSNDEALKFAEIGRVFNPENETYSKIIELVNQKKGVMRIFIELRNLKGQIRQRNP